MQDETPKRVPLLRRWGKQLLKQFLAALVCGLLVWGMKQGPVPLFHRYTAALGHALRYETDFSFLQKTGNTIIQRFSDLFDSNEDTPEGAL